MMENPKTCSKCGSPVAPEMKFCESCGAKIEPVQSCIKCGAALAPGVKFCESCGTPVAPVEATAKVPEEEPGPVVAPVPPAPEPEKIKKDPPRSRPLVNETPLEVPKVSTAAASTVSSVPRTAPIQKIPPSSEPPAEDVQIEAAVAAAVDAWTKPESGTVDSVVPKETGQKKPIPQKTMIIAGILVLALLGAAAYFVVLPMLSGSGSPAQNQQTVPVTSPSGSSSGTTGTTADTSQAGAVSLTAGPTQVPPSNRVVIVDAERDPISSQVTVTFKGGAGQHGVREILVTLTRSDGSVITKTFKPDTIGSGVTLQGTARTDRVEVTTYFYTGEQYKILDQIFEYKKRSG
jgi:hypothetical protein